MRDRLPLAERHHRGIDQRHLGAVVVDQAEQQEAGDQGRVGLPHEPVQLGRQRLGRELELLGDVEAAAMHRPDLAADALGGVGRVERRLQVVVEPDEVERGADPGDADDHDGPSAGSGSASRRGKRRRSSAPSPESAKSTRLWTAPMPMAQGFQARVHKSQRPASRKNTLRCAAAGGGHGTMASATHCMSPMNGRIAPEPSKRRWPATKSPQSRPRARAQLTR